jgi:hypothetical protein
MIPQPNVAAILFIDNLHMKYGILQLQYFRVGWVLGMDVTLLRRSTPYFFNIIVSWALWLALPGQNTPNAGSRMMDHLQRTNKSELHAHRLMCSPFGCSHVLHWNGSRIELGGIDDTRKINAAMIAPNPGSAGVFGWTQHVYSVRKVG